MTSVIELYEQLSSAPDDKTRARLIAEAFEQMEQRYSEVTDLATGAALRETELRLQKEIEQLRGEVKKDIEKLRGDVQKDIEKLRGEVKKDVAEVRGDIAQSKIETIKWTVAWTGGLLLAQATLILGGLRYLLG
ncbi:CCDC90 family protein [Ectothiorhodospira variabilis]|uniref:CCDC90 family protein n=1 Tax=Ectothiorhodospira variabilis TaxID=505694 RepID=UPI001EFA5A44|nr:CCDC90 family protein [Ectothiorhodospira variabilis]MCG5495951.1 CCDC90 family protein [Ectothiorhodospira variabilis]MCG5498494.1 CCDC90 family protein [Ectothiorhodospira variabilis]MCG5505335.1 CCDC90 family protein [Ectothiorhodospira variabilis]MCG5508521.1 CCDC90 family protein [Ectothiorhodospira variabilis]